MPCSNRETEAGHGRAPIWELASSDNLVFAGASSGIYYSEDRGRTWVRAHKGLPDKSPGIAFLIRDGLVLAGAQMGGIRGNIRKREAGTSRR